MSEFESQRALALLLTNDTLREAFLAGDVDTLVRSGIAEDHIRPLRGIDAERLDIFSELLLINRLAKAVEGLPWTTKVLGSRLPFQETAFGDYSTAAFASPRALSPL